MESTHPEECEVAQKTPPENLFTMKIHKCFKSALDRQLGEAVSIARAGGMEAIEVMNRKDEYTRCIIPRLRCMKAGGMR